VLPSNRSDRHLTSTVPAPPVVSEPCLTSAHVVRAGRNAGAWLVGRDEVVTRVLDICTMPTATAPIVVITGQSGIGRTSVLTRVKGVLRDRGLATAHIPLARNEHDVARIVARLADELGFPARRGVSSQVTLNKAVSAVTGGRGRLVVFVDDLQNIDARSLAGLASLVPAVRREDVRFVCTMRTPAPEHVAELAALRSAGAVHEEHLRPLNIEAVEQLLAHRLHATPAPETAAVLRKGSRGIPSIVHAGIDTHLDAGERRVVDWQARSWPAGQAGVPSGHAVLARLRELGSPCWSVLKALAVLFPLSGPVPMFVARATGAGVAEVEDALRRLCAAGVLIVRPNRDGWRFRIPMIVSLLRACHAPYEKVRVAEIAVHALWSGAASCDDAHYLPERLAEAGRLVDPERAAAELMAHAEAASQSEGDLADRWGRAAVRLIDDSARRAAALHRHVSICVVHRRFDSAAELAELVLRSYSDELTAEQSQELQIIHAIGLAGSWNASALRDLVAAEQRGEGHGGDPSWIISQATALCLLDRWHEAREQLTRNSVRWRNANPVTRLFGRVLCVVIDLVLGTSVGAAEIAPLTALVAQAPSASARDVVQSLIRTLTLFGSLVDQRGRSASPSRQRTGVDDTIRACAAGDWDRAIRLARSNLDTASSCAVDPGQTAMVRELVIVFTERGEVARARTELAAARSRHLLLPHLLTGAEAALEEAIGERGRARELLTDALDGAAEAQVLVGTDELWLRLAELEVRSGDVPAARACAKKVAEIAQRLGTADARVNHLLAKVVVDQDAAAAAELTELAETRQSPYEIARALAAVAASGLGDERTVRHAYEIFGELDALMSRARLRAVMRDLKVSVAGRTATLAENERLLATLVAQGLTNAQLAIALSTSEKSVEGRLTRLFQRAGYRSRAELASAILSGEFSARPSHG
jgi:DNA-binding CsgD family transcriptional regulator/tetratricopeptide (TPR) repeat protein